MEKNIIINRTGAKRALRRYMKSNKISWRQFADKSDLSRQTLYNLLNGSHMVMPRTAKKIQKATEDLIPWSAWSQ